MNIVKKNETLFRQKSTPLTHYTHCDIVAPHINWEIEPFYPIKEVEVDKVYIYSESKNTLSYIMINRIIVMKKSNKYDISIYHILKNRKSFKTLLNSGMNFNDVMALVQI